MPTQSPCSSSPAERVPRVSVGLPVYNGQRYLRECLESLLAQDFEDFELIVSDNGSTDGTEAICREFASRDCRIRYLREEQNRGAAWNFNRLPALARAEYFRWACHDDACESSHLRTCVEALERAAPPVVLAFTGTAFIDEHGAVTRESREGLDTRGLAPHARYRHLARNLQYTNAMYGLFRREALLKTRLLAPYASSDYVLMAELALHGEFWELPGYLFRRRMHPLMSFKANTTAAELAAFLDTQKRARRLSFPELSMIRDHARAVGRARIGAMEKLLSFWVLVRFWVRRRWRNIGRELLAPILPRFRRLTS